MNSILRAIAWSLALGLAVLPVVAALNGWFANDRWPIQTLSVQAAYQRVSEQSIRDAVLPHAARGFFAVDLEAVRESVAEIAWVQSVEVRKRWPNALELSILEHQPFARWGERDLVSREGDVFPEPATGAPHKLPSFDAPKERLVEVIGVYRRLATTVAASGNELVAIRLSARGSWSLRLADDARIMIGRGDPLARMERLWPLLLEVARADDRPMVRADFRYGNGFSLQWGTVPASADLGTGSGA